MSMQIPTIDNILLDLKEYNDNDLSQFTGILKESFKSVQPVFTKQKYVDFFWQCASTVPGWIEQVVLANADAESEGSKKLLELWKSTTVNKEIEDSILFHARDESRHSHLFVKLVSMAFPNTYSKEDLKNQKNSLTKIKPADLQKNNEIVSDNILLDHLIQMNMGEIRTLVHMHFLGPVIYSMTPKESQDKVATILQGLAKDEVVHIGYTSKLIEDWCSDGNYELAKSLYRERLYDFHKLTVEQTEDTIKQYGQNRYPMLLEI
jgi:hypothetical protein